MQIETILINERNNSLLEFARKCEKKTILLIKSSELVDVLEKTNENLMLEKIEYVKGKYIFLINAIGEEYIRPETLENISNIYYIQSVNKWEYIENQIIEMISDDQIATFLQSIDSRKRQWRIFSREYFEGELCVLLRPKWGRHKVEFRFTDTYMPIWNMDEKWKDYVYKTLVIPILKKYFNR